MATRADVARLAGVSPSTVSYVLNGSRPIGEATKARVMAALAQLGYQPNALAAGLAGRRSPVIAMHMPTGRRRAKESDLDYLVGAAEAATAAGRMVMLWTAGREEPEALGKLLAAGLVGGMLLMEINLDDDRVTRLTQAGVPFALIGRTADTTGLAWADRDFLGVAQLAVAHLAGLGHRHLAFLDAPAALRETGYGVAVRAAEAARVAARDAGLGLVVLECDLTVAAGHDALRRLRARHPHVTGVIAFNDEATMGLFQEAQVMGLAIPEDLSVLSTSLSEQRAAFFHPAITTISPPAAQIAASATQQLMALMGVPGSEEIQSLWVGDLMVRSSTAPPPFRD